jgi:RHS repeat-associated protein
LASPVRTQRYFAGQRVGQWTDRRGDVRFAAGSGWKHYYPYGEEITSTTNDTYKFAQLYRDGDTGLDYAMARYLSAGIGRFLTLDSYRGSGDAKDPTSWNRYSYARADPMNYSDPSGLYSEAIERFAWCASWPHGGELRWICGNSGSGSSRDLSLPDQPGGGGAGGGGPRNVCPPFPALPSGIPNDQIEKNVKEAHDFYNGLLANPQTAEGAFPALLGFFVGKFSPGGDWDYKKNYQPGTSERARAQDFGNFNFGAVLESFGFSYYFTQNAAGAAQVAICVAGGACGSGIPGLLYPFGDQVADAVIIKWGFDYQKAKDAHCTP